MTIRHCSTEHILVFWAHCADGIVQLDVNWTSADGRKLEARLRKLGGQHFMKTEWHVAYVAKPTAHVSQAGTG